MNTDQPKFLQMGINYPPKSRAVWSEPFVLLALAASITALILASALKQSWANERALSRQIEELRGAK